MQKLDMTKVSDGVTIKYHEPNADETVPTVTLAHAGNANRRYQRRLEALTKPYRRQVQLGTLPMEKDEELLRQAYIETIILGWTNFQPNDDGIEVPFSKENAETYLSDPVYRPFYDWIREEAQLIENFRAEARKEEAKN